MSIPETPAEEVKRKLKQIGKTVGRVVRNLDDDLIHGIASLHENKKVQSFTKGLLKTWRDVLKELDNEKKEKP